MSSLASASVRGVVWSAIERFSLQGVQFLIGIVLARLLSPSDFGLIGMLSIFLSVSQTFIDCGFSNALIRQKETTEKDYGTAFLVNFLISLLAFAILFVAAPFVASFYGMPLLSPVLRCVSLTLVLNALFAVHRARLTRSVDFKTQSKASLAAAVLSGVLGICMAYAGFGVWSLVVQSICNAALNLLLLTVLMRWFPRPGFCKKSFDALFAFGSRLLAASLIHSVYINLYNLVIGKRYSAADLGFFTRAYHLARFPSNNFTGILNRVSLPILSRLQDDSEKLASVYAKYLKMACFAIFPLMFGLAALAEPTVVLLLGEKWRPSVLLLQILCLGFMFEPVIQTNLNLLYVKGRSDLVLRLEIVKKVIAVAILAATSFFGIRWMCAGCAFFSLVDALFCTFYSGRFIRLGTLRQALMLAPYYMFSLLMGVCVFAVSHLLDSNALRLLVGIPFGAALYLGLAWAFRLDALTGLWGLLKGKLR